MPEGHVSHSGEPVWGDADSSLATSVREWGEFDEFRSLSAPAFVLSPLGRTAARASKWLTTSGGSVISFHMGAFAAWEKPFSSGTVECSNWVGWNTSYFVDHFKVFSYPGQGMFLFLHWRHEGA